MADFQVTLHLLDLAEHEPPRQTALLFYDAPRGRQARGWLDADGHLVLVGANWHPTHFAREVEQAFNEAEVRARGTSEPVHQCPVKPNSPLPGCGLLFTGPADEEGLLNCPRCNNWFAGTGATGGVA